MRAEFALHQYGIASGIVGRIIPSSECKMLNGPVVPCVPQIAARLTLNYGAVVNESLEIATALEVFHKCVRYADIANLERVRQTPGFIAGHRLASARECNHLATIGSPEAAFT